ncbi:MAG TPA: hypothetical protein DCQ84_14010 [Candidatus Competibacteraceae bacterium]|nr:hypothetical protein [Candidatus Competibacteraceae bacterium]
MKAVKFWAIAMAALAAGSAVGAELYRWTDPETGRAMMTPTLPPYPVKEKQEGGSLPNGNVTKLILDENSAPYKAVMAKKKAEEAERKRLADEKVKAQAALVAEQKRIAEAEAAKARLEASARAEQERQAKIQAEIQAEKNKQANAEAAALYRKLCPGPVEDFGIQIGMSKERFRQCFSTDPDKVNATITAGGTKEQWVYLHFSTGPRYFYFMNDVLVAIQK